VCLFIKKARVVAGRRLPIVGRLSQIADRAGERRGRNRNRYPTADRRPSMPTPPSNPEPHLRAHHVGLTVSDLDRAVDFYRDALGLPVENRFSVDGEAFATAVGVDGASADFAHLDADGARVELVEYDPEGDALDDAAVNQPGASHVGLSTADLDAFYESLPDDVETQSAPQRTSSGTRILFLRDPEGNLVEVLEA
jgi:catechol 2,3-dioxygenase-like lactoylglutathione lyase family enzyme